MTLKVALGLNLNIRNKELNIGLIKKLEDDLFVYYCAYLDDVYEKNENGTSTPVVKYALVKYYKNIPDLEFVWDQTDLYFHEKKNVAEHMLGLIFGKMNRCNKEGFFPEKTGIATG